VQFEVELPFLRVNHCHCTTCQKHSGTVHSTSGRITPDQLRITKGEELIKWFQPSPSEGRKTFCSNCGSSLFGGAYPDGPHISVRFGVLDDDPGQRPQMRTYVSSTPPWYDVPDDGLPRHERAAG